MDVENGTSSYSSKHHDTGWLPHSVEWTSTTRAVRYDDIYRMDEIKIYVSYVFYRLFCGVAKYIVYGNTFHHLSDCDLYTPPTTGREGRQKQWENDQPGQTRSSFLNEGLHL